MFVVEDVKRCAREKKVARRVRYLYRRTGSVFTISPTVVTE